MSQISTTLERYSAALPKNIVHAGVKSALISFAISTVISGSLEIGTFGGVLAGTISVISGLTMPFFAKYLAEPNGQLKWTSFSVTQIANFGLSQILLNSLSGLTGFRINLISLLFINLILTAGMNGFKDHPIDKSPTILTIIV